MQNVIFYVLAKDTLGEVRNRGNDGRVNAPTLTKAVDCTLKMRLFKSADSMAPYPISSLSSIVSWSWQMDSDFNQSTTIKLQGDSANISVSTVTDVSEIGEEQEFTEISIPMESMDTEELEAWLGNSESKSGLHGELVGCDANSTEVFVLQIKDFTVRGRISGEGSPSQIVPEYYTKLQVQSLIAAGLVLQFSADGSNWHDTQASSDKYFRMRSGSSADAAWSNAIELIQGQTGPQGVNEYLYIAYASDSSGTGWSMTPSPSLKYRAEIQTNTPIETVTADDFEDATWVKYIGDDGTGTGDMTKAVYDPNNDGSVVSADYATSAGSVDWSGVTNPPGILGKPGWQQIYESTAFSCLYTSYPILRSTAANGTGTIALAFDDGILDEPDGTAYTVATGEALTWELHLKCSANVLTITTGDDQCTVEGITIPSTLPLLNSSDTYHVFTIRALYKSGAVNNVLFQANYAYSYNV